MRCRAMTLPRRTFSASDGMRSSGSSMTASMGSTIGVISTRSVRQPSASTTRSASVSEASDEVRYGIRTARRLAAPIARAARKATVAESTPPERPTTRRSKPACRIWDRMKPMMTSTAWAGSIAGSGGNWLAMVIPRERRRSRALGDDPVELSSHELEPLVGEERQAVRCIRKSSEFRVPTTSASSHSGACATTDPSAQDPRAAPEREALSLPTRLQNASGTVPSSAYVSCILCQPSIAWSPALEPGARDGPARR